MPSLPESIRRLESATLDLCWGQWTSAGLAGVRSATRSIVDPEPLILLTVGFADADRRLLGELLDWLVVNADVVDLSRLRRLRRSATPQRRQQLTGLALRLGEATPKLRAGWASIAREGDGHLQTELLAAEEPADWGTLPPAELRSLSREPAGETGAGARFRARALAGVGARAETLLYLWTHEWAHGRLLAERAAYSQEPVAAYLAQLAVAGLVERRPKGNRVLYRATPELRDLGRPAAEYVDWVAACRGIAQVLDGAGGPPDTDSLAFAVVRALTEAAEDLAAEGFGFHVPDLAGWARQGDSRVADVVEELTQRVVLFAR